MPFRWRRSATIARAPASRELLAEMGTGVAAADKADCGHPGRGGGGYTSR